MIYILIIAMVAVAPMLLFYAAADLVEWLLEALGIFTNES